MAKRKSTGKRQRFEVFKRDKFTCQYCGRTPPTVVLVIDHVIPVAAGGESAAHNLVTSCEACNQGKADGLLSDAPQAIDKELAQQVERHEQLREFNKHLLAAKKAMDELAADIGRYWCNYLVPVKERGLWIIHESRLNSVREFLKRLPAVDVYEAVDIALARIDATNKNDSKAWKYFCGVCWNKVRKREGQDG